MEDKDLPYFKVTDGKVLISKNNEESEPSKAVELLAEVIEMIEDSIISISLSDKTDKERGKGGSNWDNYNFKVKLKQAEGINGTAGGINGTILAMMKENGELMRKIELQAKEHELNELKKEIREIKEDKNKPDVWEKYLPLLSAHFGNKTPIAVAGADDGAVAEAAVDRQQKIRAALVRLSKIDENLADNLTLLANLAEKHPDKYKSFIPIIRSQI